MFFCNYSLFLQHARHSFSFIGYFIQQVFNEKFHPINHINCMIKKILTSLTAGCLRCAGCTARIVALAAGFKAHFKRILAVASEGAMHSKVSIFACCYQNHEISVNYIMGPFFMYFRDNILEMRKRPIL